MCGFTQAPIIFFSIRKLPGKCVRICDLMNLCSILSKEMFVGLIISIVNVVQFLFKVNINQCNS